VDPYLRDVLDVCLRMLHVIAGIAWIGASFYFVRLDLAPPAEKGRGCGVAGEFWGTAVASTTRKVLPRPPRCPPRSTGLAGGVHDLALGFALLVVLYYFDADVRLVDPAVPTSRMEAIALSSLDSLADRVRRPRRTVGSGAGCAGVIVALPSP
jgi:uncharacterized membrane protein